MKMKIEALRQEQISEIAEKTEKLLAEQGIVVKDAGVRDFFAKKGASVSGESVRLPKEVLRGALKSVPGDYVLHARKPEKSAKIGIGHDAVINPNSGMSFIQDAQGKRRPATVQDQIDMLKLNHTSDVAGVSNAGILYPTVGIELGDAKFVQMINALTYSDKPFFSQGIDESYGKAAIELARIATGFRDRPVCMSVANSLAPMAWDEKMLGMIRVFAEENQPINISSSSMVGATAPISLTGAVIMACAEGLFGIAYSQLIRPGAPVVFGCFPGVMNMRSMRMSYGAPEFSILCAAGAQMASYYRIPYRGGGGLTSAQVTDAQSAAESALGLMIALNCGVHYMHQSIGTLDSILTCSAEKFVMDEEIVARIRRMQKGAGEIDSDSLDVIKQGFEEGSFLGLESTAMNFRDVIFEPFVSEDCTYNDWVEKKKSSEEVASRLVKKRLAEYSEPDIGASIKKELKECAVKMGANL
ncbi:MAG: trimethylamine methyltransferase family protein [Spirochaetes bacterium]|nr:trimethylamine methyltransferase family protein [Spirochaetota bacterium]